MFLHKWEIIERVQLIVEVIQEEEDDRRWTRRGRVVKWELFRGGRREKEASQKESSSAGKHLGI
jgi:hypothetical protein